MNHIREALDALPPSELFGGALFIAAMGTLLLCWAVLS